MDENTRLGLLLIGIPVGGAIYCGLILLVMFTIPWAQQHPIIMGSVFVVLPSVISGSIWLKSSLKANSQKLDT